MTDTSSKLDEIAALLLHCSDYLAKASDLVPSSQIMLRYGGAGARSSIEAMANATQNLGAAMRRAAIIERSAPRAA